jgi:hypothetical protein
MLGRTLSTWSGTLWGFRDPQSKFNFPNLRVGFLCFGLFVCAFGFAWMVRERERGNEVSFCVGVDKVLK